MLKILIADDHAVVRRGLKQIFEETPDISVIEEAVNGRDVMDKVSKHKVDLVILDIKMPDKNGLDVLKELRHKHPDIPVIILSIYSEDLFAKRAFKIGASGYLTKETAPDELVKAIRQVIAGGKYVSTKFAESLVFDLASDSKKLPHEQLSDREFQVMRLLASGKKLTEIADQLFLSSKTISTNRTRILKKMKMKTNAELIRYAIKNSLVE